MTAYARPATPRTDLDALAEQWQREPSDAVATQLWQALRPVVIAISRRRRVVVDEDDMRGVCAIAFMTALRSWRRGAGRSFRTWAALWMRGRANAECDQVRYQQRIREHLDPTEAPAIDALHAIMQGERKAVLVKVLDELRGRMSDKEWHAVEGRLLRGLSCAELAAEAGLTKQAVHARSALVVPFVTRTLRERLVGVV
jgi:RNA polymerase sigma factor (sigma-70 family)